MSNSLYSIIEKYQTKSSPNKLTCAKDCRSRCCRTLNIVFSKPKTFEEYDAFYFYLLHGGVVLRINNDSWELSIETNCTKLKESEHGTGCSVYKNRPIICEDYPPNNMNCEYLGILKYEKKISSPEEYLEYVKEHYSKPERSLI